MNTKPKSPDRVDTLEAEIRAMREEIREGLRVLTISAMSTSSALHVMREQQLRQQPYPMN
jgi:hypothetical protein